MSFSEKVMELSNFFKETDEYKRYIEIKMELKEESEVYEMVRNFKNKQQEVQIELMNTGKRDKDKQQELENMYKILIDNAKVNELFEYEVKLDLMLAEMQKIMGDSVQEIVEF